MIHARLIPQFIVSLALAVSLCAQPSDPFAASPQDPAVQDPFAETKAPEKKVSEAGAQYLVTAKLSSEEGVQYSFESKTNVIFDELDCHGMVALSGDERWVINVNVEPIRDPLPIMFVSIDNLSLSAKDQKGKEFFPSIFRSQIHYKGPGEYVMGKMNGMTLTVVIDLIEKAPAKADPNKSKDVEKR